MSEKYTTVKSESFERDKEYPFSPDRIRVLRRNEDNIIVLQIRMVNNYDKIINRAAIEITCFPSQEKIPWTYTGLSEGRYGNFGTKVPVDTGMTEVENVKIEVTEAEFEDGTIWTAGSLDSAVYESEQDKGYKPVEASNDTEHDVNPVLTEKKDNEQETVIIPQNDSRGKKYILGMCGGVAALAIAITAIGVASQNNDGKETTGTEASVTVSLTEENALAEDDVAADTTAATKKNEQTTAKTMEKTEETTSAKAVAEIKFDINRNYVSEDGKFSINEFGLDGYGYIGFDDNWIYFFSGSDDPHPIDTFQSEYGEICVYEQTIKRVNVKNQKCESLLKTYDFYDPGYPYEKFCECIIDNGTIVFSSFDKNSFYTKENSWGEYDTKCAGSIYEYNIKSGKTTELCSDADILSISGFSYKSGWLAYTDDSGNKRILYSENGETGDLGSELVDIGIYAIGVIDNYILFTGPNNELVTLDMDTFEVFDYPAELNTYYIGNYEYADGYIYVKNYMNQYLFSIDTQNHSWTEGALGSAAKFENVADEYIGIYGNNKYYVKNDLICKTSSTPSSDYKKDKLFDLDNIINFEKYYYNSLGWSWDFDDSFYLDYELKDNWIIINASIQTGSFSANYFHMYFLNTQTGECISKPIADATNSCSAPKDYFSGGSASSAGYDNGYYEIFDYGYVSVESDTLNVRSGPSTSYDKVGTLADGATVYIWFYEDGWYYVYYDKTELYGYVSADFINLY